MYPLGDVLAVYDKEDFAGLDSRKAHRISRLGAFAQQKYTLLRREVSSSSTVEVKCLSVCRRF